MLRLGRDQYAVTGFENKIPFLKNLLAALCGKPDLKFLEVGSFAGASAEWLLRNVLTHETAALTCVDIWNDRPDSAQKELILPGSEEVFYETVAPFAEKVSPIKGRSQEKLKTLKPSSFDFIFIDGSHETPDVLTDAILALSLLKTGGVMVFDDFSPNSGVFMAVNFFLEAFKNSLEVLHEEHFVAVKRIL